MTAERLALFTTVYPAVLPYLRAWYGSVLSQTDTAFDLWVAADDVMPSEAAAAAGTAMNASWVSAEPGDTPSTLRSRAISLLVSRYPAVIFVDSDDLLEPTRVAAAREALARCDVNACALRLVNVADDDLGITLAPAVVADAVAQLPVWNVFGLSNTAYRSTVLERCLPVPPGTALVDWYLATAAWVQGAHMEFDIVPRMRYRQHGGNMARVVPPFTPDYLERATTLVSLHHQAVSRVQSVTGPLRAPMERAAERVRAFRRWTSTSPGALASYSAALHELPTVHAWWWCVAHPDLEVMWSSS